MLKIALHLIYKFVISGRPALPPYWALGLHICRDAARDSATNASLVFRDEAFGLELPFDSDCVDDSALGNTTFVTEPERLEMVCKLLLPFHCTKKYQVTALNYSVF